MEVIRCKRRKNFTQVGNEVIRDDRLTHMARGVLIEILSHKDGWSTTADELWQHASKARPGSRRGEGRRAYRAVFAEMEEFGYLVRERRRLPSGRFETVLIVHDEPVKPASETPGPASTEVPLTASRPQPAETPSFPSSDRRTANGPPVNGTSTTSTRENQHSNTGSPNKVSRPASRRGRTGRSAAASTPGEAIMNTRRAAVGHLPHDQASVEEMTDSEALGLWYHHVYPRRAEIRDEVAYLGGIFKCGERLDDFLAKCEPVCPGCVTYENSCTCYEDWPQASEVRTAA